MVEIFVFVCVQVCYLCYCLVDHKNDDDDHDDDNDKRNDDELKDDDGSENNDIFIERIL